MIHLTRLNQAPVVVNSDLIEHIETTPDTVIVLTTGQKLLVRESVQEIIDRVVRFRRRIAQDPVEAPAVSAFAARAYAGNTGDVR